MVILGIVPHCVPSLNIIVVIGAVVIVSSSLSNHLGITDPTKGSSSLGIVVSVLGCLLLVIDNLREVIGELSALLVRELR